MCPSAPRACSEPGGQKPVLSLSLDLIERPPGHLIVTPYGRDGISNHRQFDCLFNGLLRQATKTALTHWGRVTHICVSEPTIISSDNGLSPGRRQAIIWTNAGILLIRPQGTNFNEILIEIHIISFTKIHLKMSSGKWRPFCLGLNVLKLRITGHRLGPLTKGQ